MKKDELLKEVAGKCSLSQSQVNEAINTLTEVIITECRDRGGEVNIPSLGRFKQKVNPAKKGINPLTKKPMDVPESHTIKFTPTASVKAVVETKNKAKK
jgi:DNA-binding protein HU-beta